jgi:hypothetical protein
MSSVDDILVFICLFCIPCLLLVGYVLIAIFENSVVSSDTYTMPDNAICNSMSWNNKIITFDQCSSGLTYINPESFKTNRGGK